VLFQYSAYADAEAWKLYIAFIADVENKRSTQSDWPIFKYFAEFR
jgi:hypothetical protein